MSLTYPPGEQAGALAFAETHLDLCEAGKTLLLLFVAGRPRLALAAGLHNTTDRGRFLTLARYLVRREAADSYWLVVPMEQDGAPCLLIESGHPSDCRHSVVSSPSVSDSTRLGEPEVLVGAEPLLGDLFAAAVGLPAILRRQLDQLAVAFALPLARPYPGAGEGEGLGGP